MAATLARLLAILVAFIQLTAVVADFDLYQVSGSSPIHHHGRSLHITAPGPGLPLPPFNYGWQIFDLNNEPTCDQLFQAPFYQNKRDLSHGRLGINCVGRCGITDPPWANVQRLEMHFTNQYHATIYKDDGYERDGGWKWTLWGVNGKNYGECFTYDNHDLDCKYPETGGHFEVSRKFRCSPNDHDITAEWINQRYMEQGGETMGHKYHGKRAVDNATAIAWIG
ncbi:hypothetical protein PMIN07_011184 [Paraphaeosphaeria minitans]